jgi:hypothetical protein
LDIPQKNTSKQRPVYITQSVECLLQKNFYQRLDDGND